LSKTFIDLALASIATSLDTYLARNTGVSVHYPLAKESTCICTSFQSFWQVTGFPLKQFFCCQQGNTNYPV